MMTLEAMGSSSNGIFEIIPNHILYFLGMQLCQKMGHAMDHEWFELPFDLSLLKSSFYLLPLSLCLLYYLLPAFLPSFFAAYNSKMYSLCPEHLEVG